MSDYFGALLRSAGGVAVASPSPSDPFDDAGWGEQNVEVDAASVAGELARVSQDVLAPAPTGESPAVPVPSSLAPANTPSIAATQVAVMPAPKRIELGGEEVHPAVRAALDWVAADPAATDPFAVESIGLDAAPPPRVQPSPQTTRVAAAITPTSPAEPARVAARAVTRNMPEAPGSELRGARIEAASQPVKASHATPIAIAHPARHRPDTMTVTEFADPAPRERAEVHIGTIHVRVDAPPAPRVVAQPAPAAPRAAPAAPPQRSAFSRSRSARF